MLGFQRTKIMSKPTIGRIVIYNTTEAQRKEFEKNNENQAKQLPAIIVAVWSNSCVNLKVITDGKNDLWVTSSVQGEQDGNWNWPTIQK